MGSNNRCYDHYCWTCFTGNDDHSPGNDINHNTQNTLWGNKPMIVQLSCHTIKSTTAQTFENAENAEIGLSGLTAGKTYLVFAKISQGWYVAALKIVTAHGRGATDPSPVCSDYLKSTKTFLKFNCSIFSIGHFTTSTSNIGTNCPLIFHISLVSEPHLDVYIQLEYLARSAT